MEKQVNKKFFLFMLFILIFISIGICYIFYLDNSKIERINLSEYKENENIVWNLKNISKDDGILTIEGKVYIPKLKLKNIKSINCNFVLKNTKTNEELRLPTCNKSSDIDRFEITSHKDNKKNIYISKTKCNNLKLDKNDYEIIIEYIMNDNKYIINTGEYVK